MVEKRSTRASKRLATSTTPQKETNPHADPDETRLEVDAVEKETDPHADPEETRIGVDAVEKEPEKPEEPQPTVIVKNPDEFDFRDSSMDTDADMRPHETFVFRLGLDLALDYLLDEEKSPVCTNFDEMESRGGFVATLSGEERTGVRKRALSFRLAYKECALCSFRTESSIVMDTHLIEPHNLTTLRYYSFFV